MVITHAKSTMDLPQTIHQLAKRKSIMIIKNQLEQNTVYPQCPRYSGIARIVDIVEASKKDESDPQRFRFIVEIDSWIDENYRFTVASKPLYPSIAPKSEMRRFIETVLGRRLNQK